MHRLLARVRDETLARRALELALSDEPGRPRARRW
jgi:hypothetical protein